jgi:hypothetical protein
MNHSNISQLREVMLRDLQTAFDEAHDDIRDAILHLAETREDDKPLVFSCSLGAKLDCDRNKVSTQFSFNVKTLVKNETKLDDPDQIKLNLKVV